LALGGCQGDIDELVGFAPERNQVEENLDYGYHEDRFPYEARVF